jgi:hypothetical protein
MEPVLLGLAAPSALNEAGNLLQRTLSAVAEPFSAILHTVAESFASEKEERSTIETGDLGTHLGELQSTLAGSIEQTLAAAGIDLTEPIELRVSQIDGSLEVVGDHPQRALIESALADKPELAREFTEVIALRQLLAAAEKTGQEASDSVFLGEAENDALTGLFSMDDGVAELFFK